MSKETINVKSNGLRNELKEIRKSIDALTNAILMAQTNKQHEKNDYTSSGHFINDKLWHATSSTSTTDVRNDEEV